MRVVRPSDFAFAKSRGAAGENRTLDSGCGAAAPV